MTEATDVILVGGGIMSATLGVLLKELEPSWEIVLLERLDEIAQESSNPWNNAGTVFWVFLKEWPNRRKDFTYCL